MLAQAAADAKRKVQVVEFCHQPPDHPVLVTMPESEYLRGYILRVELEDGVAGLAEAGP